MNCILYAKLLLVDIVWQKIKVSLSPEKTKLTHIEEGFDFLSTNIRKYKGKYLPKPSKQSLKLFLNDLRITVKTNPIGKTENLIRLLNPKIRGWSNYHRHTCAKETFNYISKSLCHILWSWAIRRYPNKGRKWIKHKYFRTTNTQNWIFSALYEDKNGKNHIDLIEVAKVPIERHIKIRSDASPYKLEYTQYFENRKKRGKLMPKIIE